MINDNNLRDFFANPFTAEYMKFCDELVRYSVSSISAACQLIDKDRSKENRSKYIEGIMNCCRDLMRTAELSGVLTDAAKDTGELRLIDIDSFIAEFAQGCRDILGEKCKINVTERSNAYVRTDRVMLMFYLLSRLRQLLLVCPTDTVEIFSQTDKSTVTLTVKLGNGELSPETENEGKEEIFAVYSKEIGELLCERSGAKDVLNGSTLDIVFPRTLDGTMTMLATDIVRLPQGTFSPYGVMLGDIKIT